jgi:solute:Na+ symporter, SSS family
MRNPSTGYIRAAPVLRSLTSKGRVNEEALSAPAAQDIPHPHALSSPCLPNTTLNIAASAIAGTYLLATITLSSIARKRINTSTQYLHARHALPLPITALAFLAANCGALEIVGLVATSAKYGMLALHFYWIGAIPAIIFLALFMMPIYARSGAMTVPDFLRVRYGPATQILSAITIALMMVFVAGISLYAIGIVLNLFFGWSFFHIIVAAAALVLCYTLAGGLRATVYNEILQLAITIAGLAPLAYLVIHDFHGIRRIQHALPTNMQHLWITLPTHDPLNAPMDVLGVVIGLGFILSFGYWCTDFVLIQRAFAAEKIEDAIRTPLLAGFAKLLFPALVIVPGLAAATFYGQGNFPRFDQALPFLMRHFYGDSLLALGIAAILASLISGLAGNINALSAVWTYDLYRTHLRPRQTDGHYLRIGRIAIATACLLSILTAYIALHYSNLMDYLQLLFSLFNAPLFAVFLLGMFTTWASPTGGFCGLLSGVLTGAGHNLALRYGTISYASQMLANFYGAIYAFSACLLVTTLVSLFTQKKSTQQLRGITYFTQDQAAQATHRISAESCALAALLIAICVALNVIFR